MGLYVYAIGGEDDQNPLPVQGVFDEPVIRLEEGALGVFVSECADTSVRPERRHIAATQRVLTSLSARFDILPMAFGTVAQSREDLRSFVSDHRDLLTTQLNRISGAVEMSLRLHLDVADPIAYVVQRSPILQQARERTFGGRRPPSHDSKLRLGRMFDEALRQYRDVQTSQLITQLGGVCTELQSLPVRQEREIVNVAALVPRTGIAQFEAAVHALATQIVDEIAINIGGPWAPHNFVQFSLDDA